MDPLPRLSPQRPATIPPPRATQGQAPSLSGVLTLVVFTFCVAGLYLGRTVLIPITLSVLLSFVLAPLASLLRRLYLGRVGSVLFAVLLALAIILGIGGLIGTQIAGLAQNAPRYAETVQEKFESIREGIQFRLDSLANRLGQQLHLGPVGSGANPQQQSPKPNLNAVQLAEKVLVPIADPLSTTAIVLIVTVFILLQREDLRDRLIRLFGSSDLHRTSTAMDEAARRLSRYFLVQLGINSGFGVVITVGLALIGVPSPQLWGTLAMLLRFVPYIGVPIAALLPVALSAAATPDWSMMIWTAALFAGTEIITGQAIEPLLYGHSTGLSPFAIVISAFFWTWLWGPIGLIMSTPLTLCLVVLGRHVEWLEFLDVLLGDQPALTPEESFYQRMLAGDPDEAREQAENWLRDRALPAYYDEVALKGLQHAASDAARGVLTGAQAERMKEAFETLLEDLDEYDDTEPKDAAEPARDEPEVLCIAGRGTLDDAACDMLARLLRKRGVASRVVPHGAVSRGGMGSLGVSGIKLICLCYLDPSSAPSHLRFLIRRLRQRAPHAKLLVGLWPSEQASLVGDHPKATLGADYYTSSLRQAVEACVHAVRAEPVAA